jgi:hypothetical protein
MRRFILWFTTGLLAAIFLFCGSPTAIAHQDYTAGAVTAMVHLEPDDSPQAGKPSPTWIHLVRGDEQTIGLSDCACNLTVYDSQQQAIANPELSETTVAGHDRPLSASITFPSAGDYQLVLTGQSKSNQFEPFELDVPVKVRA